MKSTTRPPAVVPATTDERGYEVHPSYGKIRLSRVRCSEAQPMFGSEAYHSELMELSIYDAKVQRGGQRLGSEATGTYIYEGEKIASLYLTQTQFAEFITSLGNGSVPCTLNYIQGDELAYRPKPPNPKQKVEIFKKDISKSANDVIQAVRDAQDFIQDALDEGRTLNKKSDMQQLRSKIDAAVSLLKTNLPWMLEQFEEQMENVVAAAKVEINATARNVAHEYGLDQIEDLKHRTLFSLDPSDATEAEIKAITE